MFRTLYPVNKLVLCCCLATTLFVPLNTGEAKANNFDLLYSFCANGNCSDGAGPSAGVIRDPAGNLYGTTYDGGGTGCNGAGCGTVFKITPSGTETVLHAFKGGSDGALPAAGLTADNAGNFYGTTFMGGASNAGTIFKVATDGIETVLYYFTGKTDGANPVASLILDRKGNLYGTATDGGANKVGTVYKLAPDGIFRVLHALAGGDDGAYPVAGLYRDKSGFLFGVTEQGGTGKCAGYSGCGTVIKLAPDGSETVLYSFKGRRDATQPYSSLVADIGGNLYGTSIGGGSGGAGTVFKLAPDGAETVLFSFNGNTTGAFPQAALLMDEAGNLYGTTTGGGDHGYGTVFVLTPAGTEAVLHSFTNGNDGGDLFATLVADKKGHLYGTANRGGAHGGGTVFKLKE